MPGDRFQFLEFEDDADGTRHAAAPDTARETGGGLSPVPLRDGEGLPLAQVVVQDPRGYGATLRAVREEQHANPTRRAKAEPGGLRVSEVIGGRGQAAGQFNFPAGLAVDADGVLYIADSYNHRVQRVTPDGGVSVIGTRGGGRGQFLMPSAVACDPRRAFYIVEQGNARVQKFSASGVLELVFGRAGAGRGEMRGPTGIAVAPGTGDIYVADTGNRRVQRFDAAGHFLMTMGGRTVPLVSPQAVAVSDTDTLYVADAGAGRVAAFDPMGRALSTFAALSFTQPRALAAAPGNSVFVSDTVPDPAGSPETRGRVREVDGRGVPGPALSVPDLYPLLRPAGLAAGVGGDVYVSDALSHRVLHWTRQ